MRPLAIILYNLNRLALLLLSLAFISFMLVSFKGMQSPELQNAVQFSTAYIPVLLVPVLITMAVALLLRYLLKGKGEKVNLGDFIAAIIAFALQIVVIALYQTRAEVKDSEFVLNIPNINIIVEKAEPWGILALVVAQVVAFFFYWVADPNPKRG